MIVYKQAHTKEEIIQILHLQQENLPKNLTPSEIREQGFLTVEHSLDLLCSMNNAFPHTLAVDNGRVIGYALSMTQEFAWNIPVLHSLFEEIKKVYKGNEFIVMGQICIAKAYRGQGVFKGLYQNMQSFVMGTFNAIITEVDVKNIRSMNAHKAIGFKELSRHISDGTTWSLILL